MSFTSDDRSGQPPQRSHLLHTSVADQRGLTSSITSQGSSTSLSTSFLHLTRLDVAFFDHVIELLPEGSSSFTDLKRAYNHARAGEDVRRRLRGSDADAALWDTLLRLTHVRGQTWAQRWDAVRLTLGLEPKFVSDEEDDLAGAGRETTDDEGTPRIDHQRSTVRPRSWHANRRLDEGIIGPASSVESPAAEAYQRKRQSERVGKREMEELRARMASLTAEAASLASSLNQEEVEEVEERARQSDMATPLRKPILLAHPHEHNRIGKEQRLRFASSTDEYEISKATTVESASDEDDARPGAHLHRHKSCSRLPPAPVVVSKPPSSTPAKRRLEELVTHSRMEREALQRAEEARQEAEEEANSRQDSLRAEFQYVNQLRGRYMALWRQRSLLRNVQQREAVRFYRTSLCSKAMFAWKERRRKEERSMRNAATVDLVRCKLHAWRKWLREVDAKKNAYRQERRMQLRGAFEVTRSRRENRLSSEYYRRWRVSLMERRASHFRAEHLLHGAISLWRIHAWRSVQMQEREAMVIKKRSDSILGVTWARWSDALRFKDLSSVAYSYDRQRTLQKYLDRWELLASQNKLHRQRRALADRWRNRRAKQLVMRIWSEKTTTLIKMQQQADVFVKEKTAKEAIDYLRRWAVREREQLFGRIKDAKVARGAIQKWHTKRDGLVTSLQAKEEMLRAKKDDGRQKHAFALWRDATSKIVAAQNLIARRRDRTTITAMFARWKAATNRHHEVYHHAYALDTFNMQKRCFSLWIAQRRERQLQDWKLTHDRGVLRKAFLFWRADAMEKYRETLAVGKFRAKMERRRREDVLHAWLERVITRKSTYLEAAEKNDGAIVQRTWHLWLQACIRHNEMINLSNSFLDVKKEEWMRQMFTKWSQAARSERSRRERAEKFAAELRRRLTERIMERWYDRYVESALHEQELECLLRRQEVVKANTLQRWKAKTHSLPAIQLDHARLKSQAFYRWRAALPFARQQRRGVQHDRLTMQAKAFDHWLRLAKAKRAFRAAARFGGPSAVRLRAAHKRISGGGVTSVAAGTNVFGGAFGLGSGRTPRRRGRSIRSADKQNESSSPSRLGTHASLAHSRSPAGAASRAVPLGIGYRDADVSSLRESDLGLRGESPTTKASAVGRGAKHERVEQQLTLSQLVLRSPSPTREGARPLADPRTQNATLRSSATMPSLRRWIQGVHRAGPDEMQVSSSEISSEPARRGVWSSHTRSARAERMRRERPEEKAVEESDLDDPRTPSPASGTQSEATMRVRNSPRRPRLRF